jgi:sugar lactone lactonase YvrE
MPRKLRSRSANDVWAAIASFIRAPQRARAAALLVGGARALTFAVVGLLAVLLPAAQGSDGMFDRAWGKDVGGPGIGLCTAAANCHQGTQGGLGGEFASPTSVATDSVGNVYVADALGDRIQKFDSSGAFLRAWGKDVGGAGVNVCTVAANCQAGTSGAQGGAFTDPEGVATDPAGNVYVSEASGNRVQKFDSSGAFLLAWGKNVGGPGVSTCAVATSCADGATGGNGGDLFTPEGVATDSSGNVYVAEFNNSRVQKFNASGTFLLAWGKNVGGAGVATCTVAASCHAGTIGMEGVAFSRPFGVGTDGAGSVYITDSSLFRVQKFDTSGAFQRAWGKDVGGPGVDICTVSADCQVGSQSGEQGGDFNANGPAGVVADQAGNVYVANAAAGGRIQEFDSSGGFLRAWGKDVGGAGVPICTVAATCHTGSAGGLGGEFASPVGVATDSAGAVYVTDSNNRRIQKFAGSAAPAPSGPTPPTTTPPPNTPSTPTPPAPHPQVTGPAGNPLGLPSNRHCVDRRKFGFRLHHPSASQIIDVKVYINGHRKRHLQAHSINHVTLTRLPKGRFRVKIVATQNTGGQLISVRDYKGCKKSRPHTRRGHSSHP